MGIFDFGKKKQENNSQEKQQQPGFDINYINSKGIEIGVRFVDLIQVDDRVLQRVLVSYMGEEQYTKNATCLMEPYNVYKNEKGEYCSQTKEVFNDQINNRGNIEVVKCLFTPDYINAKKQPYLNTNVLPYIGTLDIDENGNVMKKIYRDESFEQKHLGRAKKAIEEKDFRKQLEMQTLRDKPSSTGDMMYVNKTREPLTQDKNVR